MAKLLASETATDITPNAERIHGDYGYSTELKARTLLPRRTADDRGRRRQPDSAQT
jgi:alkylation response protein AidB-like acyl-CoA dehydrogenase